MKILLQNRITYIISRFTALLGIIAFVSLFLKYGVPLSGIWISNLLILDEPAAGLNDKETLGLLDTIFKIRDKGVTVLLIEHDMDLVFEFAKRITVLVNGAVLTEGTPDEIAQDPQVKAVYLGHGEGAHV